MDISVTQFRARCLELIRLWKLVALSHQRHGSLASPARLR